MSDDWEREDFAINEDTYECENCDYYFGPDEAERRIQAYLKGSALCALGRPDQCPDCGVQMIKWA